MASTKAIIAAASCYSFFRTGNGCERNPYREGVSLDGKLGCIAVWEDGQVEEFTKSEMDESDHYRAGHTHEIGAARQQAGAWLKVTESEATQYHNWAVADQELQEAENAAWSANR